MDDQEKMSILKQLLHQRVVSFELCNDKQLINIEECCDNFFSLELDKKEFGQFISELQDIHNKMKK